MIRDAEYGETWVYESIVGALPGLSLSDTQAVAIQLGLFQVAVVVFGLLYGLPEAVIAGTAAVFVAAVGSVAMLRLGHINRSLDVPHTYYRLLFGSSIEVVLGVLAVIALVTHLCVFDPLNTDGIPLITRLFGPEPPIVVIYLTLLVLWDLCYRLGTSWWAAVVSLWRAIRVPVDKETAQLFIRLDVMNVGFAIIQLVLVPFIWSETVLLLAIVGHVIAVAVVSAAAISLTVWRTSG